MQFWTQVELMGSIIIAPARWSVSQLVCLWSGFKYHRDRPLVLLFFCMMSGHHMDTKVIEPDF